MTKADRIFRDNMLRLLSDEAVSDIYQKVRPVYGDGTPAHTNFITQVFEEYDISNGEFPITTLRPIPWKNAIKEILWIYQDQTSNLAVLRKKYGIHWWNQWDIGDNTIGQRYGATVRRHSMIDNLIDGIKRQPYGRRHIMDLWQYNDFDEKGGLDPCAFVTLWSVRDGYLDCTLIIRSSDYLVAGHVNRIQYVALQMMIAHATEHKVGKFAIMSQNLHYYDRHREQLMELLHREPSWKKPILVFNPKSYNFYDFTIDDFQMVDYEPIEPQIKFELGV